MGSVAQRNVQRLRETTRVTRVYCSVVCATAFIRSLERSSNCLLRFLDARGLEPPPSCTIVTPQKTFTTAHTVTETLSLRAKKFMRTYCCFVGRTVPAPAVPHRLVEQSVRSYAEHDVHLYTNPYTVVSVPRRGGARSGGPLAWRSRLKREVMRSARFSSARAWSPARAQSPRTSAGSRLPGHALACEPCRRRRAGCAGQAARGGSLGSKCAQPATARGAAARGAAAMARSAAPDAGK
jgi:hypothetical protein